MSPAEFGNQTLQALSAQVARRLQHVPEDKRDAKVKSAKGWWALSGCLFAVALAFILGGFYVVATKDVTLVLAVLLGVFIVTPLLGALFAANKASGEATRAFIAAVGSLAKVGRGAVKGGA